MPTYDYFEHKNLDNQGDLEELVENLIYALKDGYFLSWEAVIREEQGLPLTKKQEKMLSELINFSEEDDDRILYIDEIPRPSEPWHQILVKVVSHLLMDRFKTYDIYHAVVTGGWPKLVECLEKYGRDLSLPEGVKSPMDVVPAEIQHKLWLQYCFDELYGIGQEKERSLENEEEHYRIEELINCLKECKVSVQYLDLTLEKILATLILPLKDEEIFVRMMMEKLGLTSTKDRIVDFLK